MARSRRKREVSGLRRCREGRQEGESYVFVFVCPAAKLRQFETGEREMGHVSRLSLGIHEVREGK